jgi:hypothetical protein
MILAGRGSMRMAGGRMRRAMVKRAPAKRSYGRARRPVRKRGPLDVSKRMYGKGRQSLRRRVKRRGGMGRLRRMRRR